MRIVGKFSKDKDAQLTRYIGKHVDVTGGLWPPTATVPGTAMNLVHGNYKPHQIDIATITAAKLGGRNMCSGTPPDERSFERHG